MLRISENIFTRGSNWRRHKLLILSGMPPNVRWFITGRCMVLCSKELFSVRRASLSYCFICRMYWAKKILEWTRGQN
ncbi:hypothetical protein RchiOBHm_Chr2g0152691 [Rosa chinensis]|uniref:Uncharacterized protein n=1 Tax=Rosa chinensis TaxID=74649 RepID=A0A2P6S0J8_ROSCH|nr:hypothetical protein RchiOBHm_Chr2g0152691 [Rosa chinensis]